MVIIISSFLLQRLQIMNAFEEADKNTEKIADLELLHLSSYSIALDNYVFIFKFY